jgi:hypothetical protein
MTSDPAPPEWAERVLQAFLPSRSFESVSGDLLEEYRDSVFPARGRHGADMWYLGQVLGYGWRTAGTWAVVFAAAFVARDAFDWRVPTTDFHMRATVTTSVAFGIFLLAGFLAGSRSGSVRAGAIVGFVAAGLAVPLQLAGSAVLLALWHDPVTLSAIRDSGGLGEVFTMPFLTVIPCVLISALGGILGARASYFANWLTNR